MNPEYLLPRVYAAIRRDWSDVGAYRDAFQCIRNMGPNEVERAHDLRGKIREASARAKEEGKNWIIEQLYETNRDLLLYCAPNCTDDYILYMEIDRPYEKKFYLPRRKQLKPIVDELDRLANGELDILGISLAPGVGKTTSAEFFLTRLAGKNPDLPILVGSHNNSFLRGMYGEISRMLDPNGEYKWQYVFPTVQVINTNAQDMMIDIGRTEKDRKRFMTFEFTSIGSGNAGKVRAGQLLYCDDLVDGLESALSRERMDKLFNMYAVDLKQRRIGNCPELHIATRWSVHDVIGRLAQMNEGNPRAKFLAYPALDANDESMFDYPNGLGYTTKALHELRDTMDSASFKALYLCEPIEREGQLYPEVELRRYFDLPGAQYDDEGNRISFDPPDAIISICDTKGKGSDYCFAPFAYQYGQDFYMEDVLCDNSAPEIVQERLIQKHLDNNVQMSRFESNAAGSVVASNVQGEITKRGGRTKITTMYTTQNKETKIIVNAPWVKEHCLWKDNSVIKDREYRQALNFLCGYTLTGKNKVDDVPDGMAQFAMFAQSFTMSKATVIRNPFGR